MTIQQLKKLDIENQRKKHPILAKNNPDAIAPYKYNEKNANGLTRCIIDAINFTGGYAIRVNNGGIYRKGLKIARECGGYHITSGKYTFNGTRGVADIDAMWNGYKVAIEVKFGKDKQSPAQIEYQRNIERSGGVYIIARTLEDFWQEWQQKVLNK